MFYSNKEHYYTLLANLEMIENTCFLIVEKIQLKTLPKKSISVFGGVPLTPLTALKSFVLLNVLFIFLSY